jgi:hypothetical protein
MLDDFDPEDDFETHTESSEPDPEEPDEEFDRDEMARAWEEWAADATPDDWWQSQLDSTQEADRLESIVNTLVSQKCRRVDLLLVLRSIARGYWDSPPTRTQLLKSAKSHLEMADQFPLSSGADFRLDEWHQMQGLLLRCAKHLEKRAKSGTTKRKVFRRELVISLLALVRRDTGMPQYRLLSELLDILVGDPALTPTNLRKMTSRQGVTKQRPLRPTFKRRRPLKKGRPVRRDEKDKEEWAQAQIEVGNWSERRRRDM